MDRTRAPVWIFGKPDQPAPALPDGYRVYAVGDIHGRDDLLVRVFEQIDSDLHGSCPQQSIEVYLGDYVDRGPCSRNVIDLLIARSRERQTLFLKGNHEVCLLQFTHDPSILRSWRQFGGLETLMSYGLCPSFASSPDEEVRLSETLRSILPEAHYRFCDALLPYFSLGDFYFVHAGVRPGVPLPQQDEEDLLWIRDEFLIHEDGYEKMIVHGHTPVREPEFRSNRINIDTGAYATGRLTCLKIENDRVAIL